MNPESIITADIRSRIMQAIANAESGTSCELRVHIEDECSVDPLDRAVVVFEELQMHKTELRNGILIYIALESRKTAIIGDVGINVHLSPGYWDDIRNLMIASFRNNHYELGITRAIEMVAIKMKAHFPVSSGDVNELSNEITFRQSGKSDVK